MYRKMGSPGFGVTLVLVPGNKWQNRKIKGTGAFTKTTRDIKSVTFDPEYPEKTWIIIEHTRSEPYRMLYDPVRETFSHRPYTSPFYEGGPASGDPRRREGHPLFSRHARRGMGNHELA